jgi:uncharacterized membrane protein
MNSSPYKVGEHFGITLWMSKVVKQTVRLFKNLMFTMLLSAGAIVAILFVVFYIIPMTKVAINSLQMFLGMTTEVKINEFFD